MLRKLMAALVLSLLLPTAAMAFEPGQDPAEEEWVLYGGAIEPADSGGTVREADGTTGEAAFVEADGDHGVNR